MLSNPFIMRLSIFQRLVCLTLLAVFAATGTSLLPAAVMVVAQLDGSHSVSVNQSQEGFHLALRHRSGDYTPNVCDHASPMTRLVVTLCRADVAGDHNFSAAKLAAGFTSEFDNLKRDLHDAPAATRRADADPLPALGLMLAGNRTQLARLSARPGPDVKRRSLKSVQMLI